MPLPTKPCKHCGSDLHYPYQCRHRPAKSKAVKVYKRPKQMGKVTRQWLATRNEWMQRNPGPWHCYICGIYLPSYLELTLDHKLSRSRHPELRYELRNLAACCGPCNNAKGSRDIEELREHDETI